MTTQFQPLQILSQFAPRTDSFTSGQNTRLAQDAQRIANETGQFNLDSAKQAQADQQAALEAQQQQLLGQQNLQNTVGNLIRLNTAFKQGADEGQLRALLEGNIARAQQGGGTGVDSQEALNVLNTQGIDALRNLAGQTTAVFQQQGLIDRPEFKAIETGEGFGTFNPMTGEIIVADGSPITIDMFKEQQRAENERIAREAAALKDRNATADKLRGETNKLASELGFKETFTAFNRIAASNDGTPAGDLALIFNYMKMLDPGSVVREGEFATAQNAAGVPDRVRNLWNNLLTGERLNPEQRTNFTEQADKIFDRAKSGFIQTAQPILNIGKQRDLTQDEILGEGFFDSFEVADVQTPAVEETVAQETTPAPAIDPALASELGSAFPNANEGLEIQDNQTGQTFIFTQGQWQVK